MSLGVYGSMLDKLGMLYDPAKIKGEPFVQSVVPKCMKISLKMTDGRFGAMMSVSLTNDVRWSYCRL